MEFFMRQLLNTKWLIFQDSSGNRKALKKRGSLHIKWNSADVLLVQNLSGILKGGRAFYTQ
jgi:hypothetical protein